MGFKKYDGSTWQPITPKKLKGMPYTGTLPATLTDTKAGYLHKYKIYGNVGENLFDYIYYFNHAGEGPNAYFNLKGIITLKANTTYTFSSNFASRTTSGIRETPFIACKHNDTPKTVDGGFGDDMDVIITTDATGMIDLYTRTQPGTGSNVDTPTLSDFENGKWVMITEGSAAPTSYKPYEECGEKTENLFDVNSNKAAGYINNSGNITQFTYQIWTYDYIDIFGDTRYTYLGYRVTEAAHTLIRVAWYDSSKSFISRTFMQSSSINPRTITAPSNAKYARLSIDAGIEDVMFVEGSTAPTSYEPYGYKLPLTSAGQNVDVYIGNDTLSDIEYVGSGTDKIYRMVDGVLTPVDPPVPFPQIPTSADSTTISWAGDGLAPSEFDSIQEWVEIPMHTYTNGEWVSVQANIQQSETRNEPIIEEEPAEEPVAAEEPIEDDMR